MAPIEVISQLSLPRQCETNGQSTIPRREREGQRKAIGCKAPRHVNAVAGHYQGEDDDGWHENSHKDVETGSLPDSRSSRLGVQVVRYLGSLLVEGMEAVSWTIFGKKEGEERGFVDGFFIGCRNLLG